MDIQHLTDAFEAEGTLLDATLRQHPQLRPLFSYNFQGVDASALKRAYLQLLKLKADYVQYTTPALRAAGQALRDGDHGDVPRTGLLTVNGGTLSRHPSRSNGSTKDLVALVHAAHAEMPTRQHRSIPSNGDRERHLDRLRHRAIGPKEVARPVVHPIHQVVLDRVRRRIDQLVHHVLTPHQPHDTRLLG